MRFAIIDDEEYIRNQIRQLVETYCEEKRIPVDCICYKEAVTFLQEYRASFDAVFMDIKMPGYNGLEAAKILRQTDKNVPLVFITNLKQYAIHGYSVDAMGFVVKPLIPYDFNVQMDKILQRAAAQQVNAVTIKTATGFQRLNIKDIFYIEVIKHKLIFHTVFGGYQRLGNSGFRRRNTAGAVLFKMQCLLSGEPASRSIGRQGCSRGGWRTAEDCPVAQKRIPD